MTLEKRKNTIIESLKQLREDCAWFNEQMHIDQAIDLLEQVQFKSDLYPDDHISKKWKTDHDAMIVLERQKLETGNDLKGRK